MKRRRKKGEKKYEKRRKIDKEIKKSKREEDNKRTREEKKKKKRGKGEECCYFFLDCPGSHCSPTFLSFDILSLLLVCFSIGASAKPTTTTIICVQQTGTYTVITCYWNLYQGQREVEERGKEK